MTYSVIEILYLFLIYACLGWCLEVAYAALETGKFVNRGFLNGPVCPIYGAGAVIVILCLTPISGNIWLLFIGAAVLTSLLELVTGFALDKLFHTRWWDYSDVPFNIGGYICLKFSLAWGLVCIALMRGINPVIYGFVHGFAKNGSLLSVLLLIFLLAVFTADAVITFVTISKLSKRVRLMEEIAAKIRTVSDNMGEHIYDGVTAAVKKGEEIYNSDEVQELHEKYEEHKIKREEEISELKEKYSKMLKDTHFSQRRIIKAFPNMRSHHYNDQLKKLKEKIASKKK